MPPEPDRPEPEGTEPITVPDKPIRIATLVRWGLAGWLVVLAVLLLTPGFPTHEQRWWLWVPVAGIVLGLVGLVVLHKDPSASSD